MFLLQYGFMRTALLAGVLLAVIMPCIGLVVVLRRQSMIGDALSHTALAGVAGGLLMGINPIVGSLIFCVLAAFGIEGIRRHFPRYSELAISIMLSAGVGLAGILSGLAPGGTNFNSFLFGSIMAVDTFELGLVAVISVLVLLSFVFLYRELFLCALDARMARLSGVAVRAVDCIFTLLTALTIAIASRTVGTLVVSSLLVLPVASAMQLARSYLQTLLLAIGFGLLFSIAGIFLSVYTSRPGATIVLVGVGVLLIILAAKQWRQRRRCQAAKEVLPL